MCYNNYHNTCNYYCCITSTQHGHTPLELAYASRYSNTQGVIGILKAHENKPDAQTK